MSKLTLALVAVPLALAVSACQSNYDGNVTIQEQEAILDQNLDRRNPNALGDTPEIGSF